MYGMTSFLLYNIIVLFTVTIACFALSYDVLGEGFSGGSGPWCWIKDCESSSPSPGAWMAITGKGWELAAYVVTFAIYMLSKFNYYRLHILRVS
jgi:hypothetical protein